MEIASCGVGTKRMLAIRTKINEQLSMKKHTFWINTDSSSLRSLIAYQSRSRKRILSVAQSRENLLKVCKFYEKLSIDNGKSCIRKKSIKFRTIAK